MMRSKPPQKQGMYGKVLLSILGAIVLPILFLFSQAGYFDDVLPRGQLLTHTPTPWPPKVGEQYPNLDLIDQNGQRFKLFDFKGKVIVLEPTGMNCPACQALSGAEKYGAYDNNPVQKNVQSFRDIFPYYAKGLTLPSRDVVFVQLLLYDMNLDAPRPEDAMNWARHFRLSTRDNYYVAVSPYDLRSDVSFNLIPGFHLIDRNFVLRANSSGHNPKHNLYKQLIPAVPRLVSIPASGVKGR
jgi:hypothetical protein